MLLVVSPAKALDVESALPNWWTAQHGTQPAHLAQAAALAQLCRGLAPQALARLMDLSEALAQRNAARFALWTPQHDAQHSRPAAFTFNGDVYAGLDAKRLTQSEVQWLQAHLRILSGLYGVLRPLDWIQPYRLEMGTALANPAGANLYAYWGETLAHALANECLAQQTSEPVLVQLASQEYFKAVPRRALAGLRVVECVFEDAKRGGPPKVVSFYAKRARGLMARYAAQKRARQVSDLLDFDLEGYVYQAQLSTADRLLWRRVHPA